MMSRGILAALDFNHNVDRGQAVNRDGNLMYSFVTHRDGQRCIIRKIKTEKDCSWREALADLVVKAMETRMVPKHQAPLGESLERRKTKSDKPDKDIEIEKF